MLRAYSAQAKLEGIKMKRSVLKSILSIALPILFVALVTIVILSLLGPSVGEPFSNIICCGCPNFGTYSNSPSSTTSYDQDPTFEGSSPINELVHRAALIESGDPGEGSNVSHSE
jgi:hypothetical protein